MDSQLSDQQPPAHRFGEPYTTHHPVPNIRDYKEQLHDRDKNTSVPGTPLAIDTSSTTDSTTGAQHTPPETPTDGYFEHAKNVLAVNTASGQKKTDQDDEGSEGKASQSSTADKRGRGDSAAKNLMSATELAGKTAGEDVGSQDGNDEQSREKPRMKFREVTDPVTHLPVNIHDFTRYELEQVKHEERLNEQHEDLSEKEEGRWSQRRHDSLETLIEEELRLDGQSDAKASFGTLGFVLAGICVSYTVDYALHHSNIVTSHETAVGVFVTLAATLFLGFLVNSLLRRFTSNSSTPHSRQIKERNISQKQKPETAAWLNNTFSSVWPLVNPDLFVSLSDMLEDVMQASLPRFVKMVRVADLGQGNEPFRILGIRWLREGLADQDTKDGMKAEQGDFVNLELALAYRSRPSDKTVKSKIKNAHLLLEFYLAGAIPMPIWVELKGMVGTCRVRLQTTPDPPFFGVMTFTFLGQPKVTLSCVPLMKKMPNMMNIPLISSFVQSSIDATMSEYVAPRSLTLDLKKSLMGDDFKDDVSGKGVLLIRIIKATDFKNGDGTKDNTEAIGKVVGISARSGSDPYVALSWSKYGKSLWLSRIITKCQTPVWEETAVMVVGPEEVNAEEKLQLTLWDSDRASADDHLGTVQVDLKELLKESKDGTTLNPREDRFQSRDGDHPMPGTITWEVGWFPKTTLTASQIRSSATTTDEQKSTPEKVIHDVKSSTLRKTREANPSKDTQSETNQQMVEDFTTLSNDIMNTSPPLSDYPSGILSIQIHQISNLTLEKLSVDRKHHNEDVEQHEEGSDLPSSYCVITINHRKVYKTRVKPKSSIPFFNAATERFVRDWRNAEIIVSVHDNRLHENNPILGCVVLPLSHVFRDRSQVCDSYPLVGGLGYGRVRISMVWRSVSCTLPREMLGWDVGTLVMEPDFRGSEDLPQEICDCARITVKTNYGKKKKVPASEDGNERGVWKREKQVHLPIKQRYSSHVMFLFRKNRVGTDSTVAFAVLWLKDIRDGEDCEIELPVWENDGENLTRAGSNIDKDYGKKLGTVKMKLKLWSGLSGYHFGLAKKDEQLRSVMQILDCASEGKELRDEVYEENSAASSSSDSSSESESEKELENSGDRGMLDDLKEYKKNRKVLHRHHRGLMQWKPIRGIEWAKDQVKDTTKEVVQKVTSRDSHEREKNKIETEV
ncbi:Tricalbin-1 [Arthrobotrys entomopaga]|nr:Tricalbin-1 [Arthrobotrys entomopaga]